MLKKLKEFFKKLLVRPLVPASTKRNANSSTVRPRDTEATGPTAPAAQSNDPLAERTAPLSVAHRDSERVIPAHRSNVPVTLPTPIPNERDITVAPASSPRSDPRPMRNTLVKTLELAEKVLDGFPIYGPKGAISGILTIIKDVEQSTENQETLKELQDRVQGLTEGILQPLSGRTHVSPELQAAVDKLTGQLEELVNEWGQDSERGWLRRYRDSDQDQSALQRFSDGIHNALDMFHASEGVRQSLMQEDILENTKDTLEYTVLKDVPRATIAGYDSERTNAPPRCFEDTRTGILEKIRQWLYQPISGTGQSIYWVNGLAGIGKSTIARTVAEDADRDGVLGASFFFSRQEKELSDARLFIPTIAYQLAKSHPGARSAIVSVFRQDSDVVKKSFTTQIEHLILEPLRKIPLPTPVLLVVDALDECNNSEDAAAKLFHAVVSRCAEVPSLRILVTSRPETYINTIFKGHQTSGIVLHEDIEQSVVSDDVRKYLRAGMSQIPEELGLKPRSPWPPEKDLDQLVSRSGKLFIWAATAIRFVGDSVERNPTSQLKILLGMSVGPDSHPYVMLDSLYATILSQATQNLRTSLVEGILTVIGTIVRLRSEMPVDAIGRFLDDEAVETTLDRIQSIIPVPTDPLRPVQIYHPSFLDFITSCERCTDHRFHVDAPTHERRLALRCLDILNRQLSEGVDTLLKPTETLSSVSKEAVLAVIPLEVQYACRFWAVHATFQPMDPGDEELASRLDKFSSTMLLRWVVALCILDAISDAVAAARAVQKWIDDSGLCSYLKEVFHDTERMIAAWSGVISWYPTQLYYSVLPFLPNKSFLARHYPSHDRGISVLMGRDNSWAPLLFKLKRSDEVAFSPKCLTMALANFYEVELYDALSGLLLGTIVEREPLTSGSRRWHVMGAAFTSNTFEVVVAQHWEEGEDSYCEVVKYNIARQSRQVHRTTRVENESWNLIRLSGDGSYVVVPESTQSERRLCIWKTDGGEDTFIPIGSTGRIQDLALTAGSAHLVAIAADDVITISNIFLDNAPQILADEGVRTVCISPDGSFLVSWSTVGGTRLWSRAQGALLATLEVPRGPLGFYHANRLCVPVKPGGGSVCDAFAERDRLVIQSLPFPCHTKRITLAPDESQIAIHMSHGTQVWSLKDFGDTRDDLDLHPHTILGMDLSEDATLLVIVTQPEIEIWDARIGRRRQVIQSQSANSNDRPVAFSPRGELVTSSGKDGIVVADVQAGVLRPTSYLFAEGQEPIDPCWSVGISFDSSKLAALTPNGIRIWDLPSGTPLHSVDHKHVYWNFQWSRIDQYLMYFSPESHMCLNTETFEEEVLKDLGDRFRKPDHLYRQGNRLRFRSSSQGVDHLFAALPSHLCVKDFCWRGDRVSVLTREGPLLLLDISGFDAYMKEFSPMESGPEGDNMHR